MGASLPVMAESPFALSGGYPSRSRLQAAWAGITRPSSLLRTHAPDLDAPRAFALARSLGLRRLLRAPAANRPFPTLSLQSLSRCLDPYPTAISRCTCSFLSGRHRPHLTKDRFGSLDYPCMATSAGRHISGLQSFTHVQAPRLARPPGCSRRFLRRAARPFTPRISRLVTCPELRYRYVCERTIHTAGLSPAGLQPCRLLPFAFAFTLIASPDFSSLVVARRCKGKGKGGRHYSEPASSSWAEALSPPSPFSPLKDSGRLAVRSTCRLKISKRL